MLYSIFQGDIMDDNEIERTYGDLRVVIYVPESIAYIERVSAEDENIIFHLEADFYHEGTDWESGFSKWESDNGWTLQYTEENEGETVVLQRLVLTHDEYERVNRFFMKFRSGTL